MKSSLVHIAECCETCNREHSVGTKKTKGKCMFLSIKMVSEIELSVNITPFTKCRFYLMNLQKIKQMTEDI